MREQGTTTFPIRESMDLRELHPQLQKMFKLVEEAKLYEMRNKFDSLSSKQQQSVADILS